jgi:hypothetical protein
MNIPGYYKLRTALLLAMLVALIAPPAVQTKLARAQENSRLFTETGKRVGGQFLTTGIFSMTGSMNEARSTPGASLLLDGRVLLTGGGYGGDVLASAEIYDPATGKFNMTANMMLPRHKQGQTTLPDGQVLVLGVADGRDWRGQYSEAELCNPQTGRFTPTGSMQNERFKLADATILTSNGELLVAGGGIDVELYNPVTRRFTTARGSTGAARYYQTTTLLPDGTILIAGGYDSSIAATDHTWLYKP